MGERGKKKKRGTRKAKVPRLRGSELVKDPKLRKFDFNRCSDKQLDILLGTFKEWRNKDSDEQIEAPLRWYWRILSTMAVTRFAEFYENRPAVEELEWEDLEGLAFLLASHKNIIDLTEGKSFSKVLDARYNLIFGARQKTWEALTLVPPPFFPSLAYCYQKSFKDAFGTRTADDFRTGVIDSVTVQKLLALDDEQVVTTKTWKDFVLTLKQPPDHWSFQLLLDSMERYEKALRSRQTLSDRLSDRWAGTGAIKRNKLTGALERTELKGHPEKWVAGRAFSEALADLRIEMLHFFKTADMVVWGLSRKEQTLFLTLQSWLTARTAS